MFFVDGNWCTNDSAPKEDDGSGNYNSILNPDDINELVATLSSVAPDCIPAAEAPSKEPQVFSVNPIPATDGSGNTIKLEPGEKVPDSFTLTSNTIETAAEAVGLNGQATASEVPEIVNKSQKEARASPEASANPETVEEKKEVESELLKEVQKTEEAGEPPPTITAAASETTPVEAAASKPAQPEAANPAIDSRDASPMSKQSTTEQTQPTSKTDAQTAPEAPKNAPESAKANSESVASSAAADKKKKRRYFFSKLKEKFSSKA
ncbi:carbohydrate-binding module family 48 protein [Periconia macrospinosa]|uniref:Carbohydrate-binding module family 48 protein n=1 Tax=Periconia macrospinosa TaxID=97972 RepID=A0A2V1CZ17_9PLEO|nr:carbohydrate-binding module family 48 protein [Periconia macrospinosa]